MGSARPTGPPPPPTVQRIRVRYAKRGRLRFTSHRDVARMLERALRRAEVPMAFSAGFSPHPKLSYVGAAPTGVASEAEYLELGLSQERDPEAVRRALDAALPPGIDIVAVEGARPGDRPLPERIDASVWRVRLPGVADVDAEAALAAFLAEESVPVQRRTGPARSTPAPPSPWPASTGTVRRAARATPRGTRREAARGTQCRVRHFIWSCGTRHRLFDPTTCSLLSVL